MRRFKVWIGKVKAKNSKANFVIFFLLNFFDFSLKLLDQFREVNLFFASVAGQQQTTSFVYFMAEILPNELMRKAR